MAGDSKEVARAHLADAGVEELPDDWDVVTLGDLFTEDRGIAVGVMYPGDHVPGGVPLIKAGDLNGSIINPHPDFRISKEKHHEYRRTALEGGELLMTLVGNVGQCAVVPSRMAGWNAARAVAVMRLAEPSDMHFVKQCLLSRPLQHLMDAWCNTTVQATLNLKEIRQLPLPWPPKKSRDAIAAFGKALDDKIELNRRMNTTLEAMARALFQSWFVDFDPVRAKLEGRKPEGLDEAVTPLFPGSFCESTVGHIPKGWEIGTIGDLGERILDKVADPTDWASEPLIDLSRMPQRSVALGEWGIGDELTTSVTRFRPKDILFGSIRPYFHKIGIAPVRGVTNVSVFVIRAFKAFDWPFLAALCSLDSTVEFATRVSKGTKMPVVGWTDLLNYPINVPPVELRQMFSQRVGPIYEGIITNIQQTRTLASLRDSLLPKLLSGELSVGKIKDELVA